MELNYAEDVLDLEYICQLMYDNFILPIFYANDEQEWVIEHTSINQSAPPLYTTASDLLDILRVSELPYEIPVIHTLNLFENYICLHLKTGRDESNGTIIVGPSSKINLLHASKLLFYLLYRRKLDISDIQHKNIVITQSAMPIGELDLQLSDRRQSTIFHQDPISEKYIFQCIQEGRKDELHQFLNLIPEENLGVLSKKSRLRNKKNLAICGITLATRAAIDGGLYSEIAYTMSDLYIQHIEDLEDIKAVIDTQTEAFLDFTQRVWTQRNSKYSKAVALVQNYIYNHLYEEITLNQLAETVNLNSSYLSQLFKREVGLTITEYIQRERIEEAKKLLRLTEFPLSKICFLLHFYDQSYFTKVFHKFTGDTPRKYRESVIHPKSI